MTYKVNGETAAVVYNNASDPRSKTPEFLSYVNSAVAYVNTAQLITDPTLFGNQVMANLSTSAATLVPSHDEGVLNGYKATYTQYGTTLLHSNAGQVELLFSTTGTSSGADTIQIQVALQRPFSHGHLWINSTDPFAPPIIDPAYLSHPADMALLREGLKMARRIGATAPLSSFVVEEVAPSANITSDTDIENWLRGDAHTECVYSLKIFSRARLLANPLLLTYQIPPFVHLLDASPKYRRCRRCQAPRVRCL